MAAESLRCIAFAYKPYDRNDVPNINEVEMAQWVLPEDNLTLLAIVGIKVLTVHKSWTKCSINHFGVVID